MGYTNNTLEMKPQSNLIWAIVGTIIGCCSFYGLGFIVGVVGIYYATQVNKAYEENDLVKAKKNADIAKYLGWAAIAIAVLSILASIIWFYNNPEIYEEFRYEYERAYNEARNQ